MAVVDYESKYDQADKIKYLNYLAEIASRYRKVKEDRLSLEELREERLKKFEAVD